MLYKTVPIHEVEWKTTRDFIYHDGTITEAFDSYIFENIILFRLQYCHIIPEYFFNFDSYAVKLLVKDGNTEKRVLILRLITFERPRCMWYSVDDK